MWGRVWLYLSNCKLCVKASLEEGARFQGDLEEDLLVGVREGSAKEGWAFKSGVVWRRAFRRRAVWDKEEHQEWSSWDVGCCGREKGKELSLKE